MEIYQDARGLNLDQLTREILSDLAIVSWHFRTRKSKTDAKHILDKLLRGDLPDPVRSIVESLSRAAYGQEGVVAIEKENVEGIPINSSLFMRKFKVRESVDLILFYDAIKRVEDLLSLTENGLRVYWQKPDHEIAELIGISENLYLVPTARKQLARIWLETHDFRAPTEEQLEFIIDTHHSIRVTARAGSGKTETVSTKILFLLHCIGFRPQHILALVFNTEARDDLIKRIEVLEEKACLPTKGPYAVMNFDRLAKGVVQPRARILKGKQLSKNIQQLVHHFLSGESENSALIKQVMLKSFQADWNKWLKNNERYSKEQLNHLRGLLMEEAIDGTMVKSKGEKRLADFFFEHEVDYQYEYPWRTDRGVVIYPDFYLPQLKLIIEYWGLAGDKDYDDCADFKRRYWENKPGYKLVEIFPEHLRGLAPDFLSGREEDYAFISELIQQVCLEQGSKFEFRRLSDEELLDKLKKRIELEFEKLLSTSLTRLGQRCRSNSDVVTFVNEYETSDEDERQFINLLPVIDQAYRDLLVSCRSIDFAQLKWECIVLLQKGIGSFAVERGTVRVHPNQLRYIFIDEFQDFSELFQQIVNALLRHSDDAVVNAVGDDWQMINRFAGSDLTLFQGFADAFPRPRELTLTTNFRSCRQIVEFCNAVMVGQGAPARVADHLRDAMGRVVEIPLSRLQLTDAEEHYFKSDLTISSLLRLIPLSISTLGLKQIIVQAQASDKGVEELKPFVFVLTRTNYPQSMKIGADDFSFVKKAKGRGLGFLDEFLATVYKKELFPTSIRAVTAHRSKGKEAEVVFLLAPEQFPLIHPSSSFLAIFGDHIGSIIDDERRLFYVACSRARQWLFLLTFSPSKLPDYLPRALLQSFSWSEAPYVRNIPEGRYRIEVTNLKGPGATTFDIKEDLKAWGFRYSTDSGLPVWWQQLELNQLDVAQYLVELIAEFKDSRVQWTLFDAGGVLRFGWPGPVVPVSFLESCISSEASGRTVQSASAVVPDDNDMTLVDPLCREIYNYFMHPVNQLKHYAPETGYALIQSGVIAAHAELAWPSQKAAIVISEEDYEVFDDAGWQTWLAATTTDEMFDHMNPVDLPAILNHLRRAFSTSPCNQVTSPS